MLRRIGGETVRPTAPPGAALIRQHNAKAVEIEEAEMLVSASAAGSAMQEHGGGIAAGAGVADENLVAIADIQRKAGVPLILNGGPAAGRLRAISLVGAHYLLRAAGKIPSR
jgi:hypothetical protein